MTGRSAPGRFVEALAPVYATALAEIRLGAKRPSVTSPEACPFSNGTAKVEG